MNTQALFTRIKTIAQRAGREAIFMALTLWNCLRDGGTPLRIKALILGDLTYLVSPLDAIPDPLPLIGYSDDLALMAATLIAIAAHVKPAHRAAARVTLMEWFGE